MTLYRHKEQIDAIQWSQKLFPGIYGADGERVGITLEDCKHLPEWFIQSLEDGTIVFQYSEDGSVSGQINRGREGSVTDGGWVFLRANGEIGSMLDPEFHQTYEVIPS